MMTERETFLLTRFAYLYEDVYLDHWAATVDTETGKLRLGEMELSHDDAKVIMRNSAEVRRQLLQIHEHIEALFQASKTQMTIGVTEL